MSFCWNDDEHRRQAQDDYRHGGSYGYDREHYRGHGDCDEVYTREFDRLRRDEEVRQEERQEEERAECRRYEARERERVEEEAYSQQAYPEPQYPESEYPLECAHADGRPAVDGHQLCAQCLGEIGADA